MARTRCCSEHGTRAPTSRDRVLAETPEKKKRRSPPTPFDHAALTPPWREATGSSDPTYDGEKNLVGYGLGPEYQPLSYLSGEPVPIERALQEYNESRDAVNSGGLWDHEKGMSNTGAMERLERKRARLTVERYDAPQVRAYLDAHSPTMGKRLLEVAILYWEHRTSTGQVALKLSIKPDRVRELIKEMRRLVHPKGQSGARDSSSPLAKGSSRPVE